MPGSPWVLKQGGVIPSTYPFQIVIKKSDARFKRGLVSSQGTVKIPAGNAGTVVVVCVDRQADATVLGGMSYIATGAWLKETDSLRTIDLPTAYFAGLHPEYNLLDEADRKRLLATIKAFAKRPGCTRAIQMPSFLRSSTGIISTIRKLPESSKLMVRFLHSRMLLYDLWFQCRSFSTPRTSAKRGLPSTDLSSG